MVISKRAEQKYDEIMEYFSTRIMSGLVKKRFNDDFVKTLAFLKTNPKAMQLSVNQKLKEKGYRMIRLSKYKYILFYTIDEDKVYIQTMIHESQNHEVNQNNLK